MRRGGLGCPAQAPGLHSRARQARDYGMMISKLERFSPVDGDKQFVVTTLTLVTSPVP